MAGLTEGRKLLHERFRAAMNEDRGRVLTPALYLANSLRTLNGGQASVLDRLCKVISEHPAVMDEFRLVALLQAELVKTDG